ncbi:MAG: tellurite resistance/C4-dicarboxylate transporter family protein [Nocardioidaceae bacterium]
MSDGPSTLAGRVSDAAGGLSPAYFALVMATGIISIGLRLEGFALLSLLLLIVAVVAVVALIALTGWRLVIARSAIAEDFTDPRRGFGFFTFVAGVNVLGARLSLDGHYVWTAVLLAVAGAGWVVFGYLIPWTAVLGRSVRPVVASANGTWFLCVVASQSVAVSAATLEPIAHGWRHDLALLAVLSWSLGVFLYAVVGAVVVMRMLLYEVTPEGLGPAYWVAMGAAAITVLAGSRTIEMAQTPMVNATRGLVSGMSVMFWAFATWLIPALLGAGWWRHRASRHSVPLRYDAEIWGLIFPLGMYAVASSNLGKADRLPIAGAIGRVWIWLAFAAWLITFIAMTTHLIRTVWTCPNVSGSRARADGGVG